LNNLPGHSRGCGRNPYVTALVLLLPIIFRMVLGMRYSICLAGYKEHLRLVMDKNKQRAIGILLVLGSILVMVATWDLPENRSPQLQ
jgi:succinate dehydrogenase/fumarate reductase cytochrome b subunit